MEEYCSTDQSPQRAVAPTEEEEEEEEEEDATVLQVYYLTFKCRSTCFGRHHAHQQELTTALAASRFTVGAWW
jgi:hypothetical protein